MGHVIRSGEISLVPNKMNKVVNFAVPTTKKLIQSLMGLVNYYRLFIQSFSDVTKPLTGLLEKKIV